MLGMFYLSCLRLSASLRVFSTSLVFSSLRVSLVCLSLRLSASLLSFYVSLVFSSFPLSPLLASLIFSSLPLVPVNRSLPSPWLGYSRLRLQASPCLKQPPISQGEMTSTYSSRPNYLCSLYYLLTLGSFPNLSPTSFPTQHLFLEINL